MKKQRITWIDTLKGLCMFTVVWGHTLPNKWPIRKYIYSFHMPAFFLISGLTFKERDMSIKEYSKKLAKSILVPYFVISLILYVFYFILKLVGIFETFKPVENIIGTFYSYNNLFNHPFNNGWFMCTLFLTEILFFSLKKIVKDDKELSWYVGILGIIGYLDSLTKYEARLPWHINTVPVALVFYFVGYMFKKHIDKFEYIFSSNKNKFITGFILGLIGLITAMTNAKVSMYGNNYGSIFLYFISAFSTTFALICFVRLFMNKSYLFKKIGEYSLFYLGYHQTAIYIIRKLVPAYNDAIIQTLLTTIYITIVFFPFAHLTYKKFPIFIGKFKKS